MPVTFSFLPGATREEARRLLHRMGEIPAVETFADIQPSEAQAGSLASVVIFERSGDTPEEEERSRQEISELLRKSPLVGEIDSRTCL